MARAAWGKAKREVLALKRDIEAHLRSGATVEETFKTLAGSNKLSVGKSTFFRHAASIRQQLKAEAAKAEVPVQITPQLLNWLAAAATLAPGQAPTVAQPAPETPKPRPGQDLAGAGQPEASPRPEAISQHPISPNRLPIGAGVEPTSSKFVPVKSGEKDHW